MRSEPGIRFLAASWVARRDNRGRRALITVVVIRGWDKTGSQCQTVGPVGKKNKWNKIALVWSGCRTLSGWDRIPDITHTRQDKDGSKGKRCVERRTKGKLERDKDRQEGEKLQATRQRRFVLFFFFFLSFFLFWRGGCLGRPGLFQRVGSSTLHVGWLSIQEYNRIGGKGESRLKKKRVDGKDQRTLSGQDFH